MIDFLVQAGLALFGIAAYVMAQSRNPTMRRRSPYVGLCGQPFWLVSALQSGAWGMLIVTLMFTAVYVYSIAIERMQPNRNPR